MHVALNRRLSLVAALAVVAFVGSAEAAKGPTIQAHVASPNSFLVSSYIIESNGEIALVDAQLFNDEADKFIAKAKKVKGTVKTIFITHAHPDHFLGLQKLKAAFPEAKLVAPAATVEAITQNGAGMLKFWREQFNGGVLAPNLATEIPAIEKHEGNTLKVGEAEFEILSYPAAEVKDAHALWHKASGALLTGDMAYNNVHLWLADQEPKGWIAALEQLQKLPVKKVYPGHGEPGPANILKKDSEYLAFFQKSIEGSKSAEELSKKVKSKYAKLSAPGIVDFAAAKYFPAQPQGGAPAGGAPADSGTKPAEGKK